MKKIALLALMPLMLLSCRNDNASSDSSSDTSTKTTSEASKTDETEPKTAAEALENVATNANKTTEAAAAKPGAVPSGYTRVAAVSAKPVRTFKSEPSYQLQDGKDYAAVIDTTQGQMVIDLYEDVPTTVNSFVWLARNHFYDGIAFHRVIDGFVVQGGDPNTLKTDRNVWGQGGPGYEIPLEVRTKYNFDEKGVMGMARAQDPNSGGSQFYITLAPASNLDGQYTVFGKVVQGLDVLDKIKKYEAPAEGTPDKMLDVYIVTKNKS
ncbi:peptidylprolyl isomerase [Deinococcus yavapaiensis]|uniref:Peptidyl-prolyl cis-trans isomerase n=1 Tax=Deinococcus yavapaiensis KR-236 TaxID=694435 RepID=A0A318SMA2_9DEIO|nr:peptidylprolyl isomerase [Deinococcus yavapaiensis]PYE53600.1 peptidylprolyl isomerase [Deinococcus yavapaiensis KR-236]